MAVIENLRDGVITLSAGDTFDMDRLPVESIILQGTAAGNFVFKIGNASMTISTGTADLSKQIMIHRKLNTVTLTSGPTGATLYIMVMHTL